MARGWALAENTVYETANAATTTAKTTTGH